jgi:hypothetical protein
MASNALMVLLLILGLRSIDGLICFSTMSLRAQRGNRNDMGYECSKCILIPSLVLRPKVLAPLSKNPLSKNPKVLAPPSVRVSVRFRVSVHLRTVADTLFTTLPHPPLMHTCRVYPAYKSRCYCKSTEAQIYRIFRVRGCSGYRPMSLS